MFLLATRAVAEGEEIEVRHLEDIPKIMLSLQDAMGRVRSGVCDV
jgi:hypothetical protein